MSKAIYINGVAAISPQKTFDVAGFLEEPIAYDSNYILAIDGDYKNYINPVQIRRMSRILKMTLSAGKRAMMDADLEKPEAIITGSGYGCIDDTEKFLLNMLENKETMLNPTAFMQSTHNSVSGMLALHMKCNAYNYTYVHRGFSFESALVDAMMLIEEGKHSVLVGGFEENSENHHIVTNKLNFWKKTPVNSFELLKDKTVGSISGEGASFVVLADERNAHTYCQLVDIKLCYKPNEESLLASLQAFLEKHHLAPSDIDLVMVGLNGDEEDDKIYYRAIETIFPQQPIAWFKHLCGEYYTSASFALWTVAQIVKTQEVPSILWLKQTRIPNPIKRVLIYNHYRGINHCFYLIES